ncbi:MAG: type II toxin-antitoxin system prevent-host-death family antitoxin [Armatimonadota bacterium]|nr:type II toxin-antitoxin system prevent-host-death family antitoxin [Armatimonadota bacterium]MDR7452119.1 type II toxin-antitoxin system prevent-host-death family antitoxin [Armatimonadota bacterium]MDR7467843.1 type II toxin-antitoxin system prevent-host-death family antitoxin [Armatimonadota bacterium]MDR7494731.1 type II toxin-antitoxin system prevent-host-death family antitoxin [Armatimonadota bacterium]MDR7499556.1 type II toxin-antitoxin system prevent-host-death family antitoxin [Arma
MRAVNIAELKNRLSAYLDRVREGEEILIRDRRRPIAKIVPLTGQDRGLEEEALVAAGLLRPADAPLTASFWKLPMPRAPARRVAMAVRWARGRP